MLAWVLCVALLLIYKPDGYKSIVFAFVAALVFIAVIGFFGGTESTCEEIKEWLT